MSFEIKDVDLGGRIGRLCTRHGCIETPAFFPVIDIMRQEVSLDDIREAGFRQIITNAYLTMKRFGARAEREGIHGLLGWDGVVMTDSGAYQILEYGRVDVDPRSILEYQVRIGSDIGVILDIPTGNVDRERARRTVDETLKRARDAVKYISSEEARGTLWVLPIQGGGYIDLVEYSARESLGLEKHFQILGLGSPTVFLERYEYLVIVRMLLAARRILPWGKPLHLFGAGHPLIIPLAVALGADMFDSASYILYARDDRYITDYGVERLDKLNYFPCSCPVCTRYTPQELRSMPKKERTRLLALHNLYAIRRAVERTKQAIREGRLWEYLEEVSRRHPRAQEAFREIARGSRILEETTPSSKGVVRGLRLYDTYSTRNPRILRYRERARRYLEGRPRPRRITLLPYPRDASECPLNGPVEEDHLIGYYALFLGLIPLELCGIYPTVHFDHPEEHVDVEAIRESAQAAAGILEPLLGAAREVAVVEGDGWRKVMAEELASILASRGVDVRVSRHP